MLGIPNTRENLRGVREDVPQLARDEISFFPQQIPRPALSNTRTCLRLAKAHRATWNFAQLFGQFLTACGKVTGSTTKDLILGKKSFLLEKYAINFSIAEYL